jgi:CHAT domain-containing protein
MYNYAAAWWLKLKNKPIVSQQMLAFAPSFSTLPNDELANLDRSYALQNLRFSTRELGYIAEHYELTSYQGAAATKAMFLQRVGEYGVLHFATHAMLDTLDPALNYLAFHPEEEAAENWKLLLAEIYQLDIEAAMVVLSTCRSGGGPLRTGEGINSLAQAFSYAGAKSVITSLWELNDQAAAEMMGHFYASLADGNTKAKALQQAKLKYLHQQTDPRLAHPYYWSALIGLGDESPLFGSDTMAWGWYIFGLGVLLLGFYWVKRNGEYS